MNKYKEMNSPNEPNFTYLYTYIPIYLYPVNPVNPVKNIILQNKPNFPIFGQNTKVCPENKANFISQFSILNSQFRSPRLRNEPNSETTSLCNLRNLWFLSMLQLSNELVKNPVFAADIDVILNGNVTTDNERETRCRQEDMLRYSWDY